MLNGNGIGIAGILSRLAPSSKQEIAAAFPVTRFVAAQPVAEAALAAAGVAARLAFAVAATIVGFAAGYPAAPLAPLVRLGAAFPEVAALVRSAMSVALIQAPLPRAGLSVVVAPPAFFAPQAALIAWRASGLRQFVQQVAAQREHACRGDPSSAFHRVLPFKNTPLLASAIPTRNAVRTDICSDPIELIDRWVIITLH